MQSAEGRLGRVFVLRLEDGERVPDCIEKFVAEQGIEAGFCAMVGGISGGRLTVGPENGNTTPVVPMIHCLSGIHEVTSVGTIFPAEDGSPRLHLHAALGRGEESRAGCARAGLEIWKIGEVVIIEIIGTGLLRKIDPDTGFELLSR